VVMIHFKLTALGGIGALIGYMFGGPYGAAIGYGIARSIRFDMRGTQIGDALTDWTMT
jgi:hypothetical protein